MTTVISAPLVGAGVLAVKTAADFQTLRQSMDILNQSAAEGARNFERLVEFSARTPFQLQDLARAQNMLQGFGLAADEAFDSLSMIGDIAAVSGGSIQGIGIAFGQAAAEGRLMTRDIRQLINQGVPAIKLLADTMNVAESEVLSLAEEGRISFDILQQAFRDATQDGGMFADGMAKQAKTIAGLFSTLKDNVSIVLADLGEILIEEFNIDEVIQNVTRALRNMSAETKRTVVRIAAITAGIGPLVLAIGALTTAISILMSPVTLVIGILAGLAAIFLTVRANADILRVEMQRIWVSIANAVIESVAKIIEFASLIPGLKTVFGQAAEGVRTFKMELPDEPDYNKVKGMGQVVRETMAGIKDAVLGASGEVSTGVGAMAQQTQEAMDTIKPEAAAIDARFRSISNTLQKIALVDIPTLAGAWANLTEQEKQTVNVVQGLTNQITSGLSAAFIEMADAGTLAAEQIRRAFTSAIAAIAAQIAAKAALFSLVAVLFPGSTGILTGGRTFGQFVFGNFAQGGRPPVGVPSIVGERGPELFVPDVSGKIIPNGGMSGRVEVGGRFRIEGQDLEAVVKREERRSNRIF
jgi:tape measure domain-containing protein